MTLTVQQLLIEAMGLVGAVAITEIPETAELNTVMQSANIMLDRWSAQKLMLRADSTLSFPLQAGKASYTVGASGSDITSSKPLRLLDGYVTDSDIDHHIECISKVTYDSLEDKNVSRSRPMYVAYDAGDTQQAVQKGMLYFYYTPDKAYTAVLTVTKYLTEFSSLSETVTFEPAYYEAIVYGIANRIFRRYHAVSVPLPVDLVSIAQGAMNALMSMNATQVIAGMELPGKVSKYNIYTDGV